MIPFLKLAWTYRKWIGYGIAVLAIFATLWTLLHNYGVRHYNDGIADEKVLWAKSIEAANAKVRKQDADYLALQRERDKAKAEIEALRNRPPAAPRTLIREVPTDAPAATCPRLSPDFRMRYNAASDAADH